LFATSILSRVLIKHFIAFLKIIQGLKNLPNLIKEVLKTDQDVQELSKELYKQKSLLVMGRGYNYATCLEGALVSVMP